MNRVHPGTRSKRIVGGVAAGVVALLMIGGAGAALVRAQDDKDAGITISGHATAKDVGLPVYPGATPHKDPKDDNSGANFGLWGGSFGFKLAVLKLDSGDSAEKVAAFYRKALGRYGTVLDCSNAKKSAEKDDDKSSKLTCGDDTADGGGLLFKAGTKEKQHIVSIKTAGSGVNIDLVFLEARGTEHEAK